MSVRVTLTIDAKVPLIPAEVSQCDYARGVIQNALTRMDLWPALAVMKHSVSVEEIQD